MFSIVDLSAHESKWLRIKHPGLVSAVHYQCGRMGLVFEPDQDNPYGRFKFV